MLGFFTHRKKAEVHRLLANRINESCLTRIKPGNRTATRTSFCEVVWLIPVHPHGELNLHAAFPAVGKDICPKGLSLIHSESLDCEHAIVGLRDQAGIAFLKCEVEHSTPIGYQFHQIGLYPEETVSLSDHDVKFLNDKFEKNEAADQELAGAVQV